MDAMPWIPLWGRDPSQLLPLLSKDAQARSPWAKDVHGEKVGRVVDWPKKVLKRKPINARVRKSVSAGAIGSIRKRRSGRKKSTKQREECWDGFFKEYDTGAIPYDTRWRGSMVRMPEPDERTGGLQSPAM